MGSRSKTKLTGHELYKINNRWVFDITTFTVYKTSRNKLGELVSVNKAMNVKFSADGQYKFKLFMKSIPIGVIRTVTSIINRYLEDTFRKDT